MIRYSHWRFKEKDFISGKSAALKAGSAAAIANVAVQAGLTHTLIKIADGDHAYNLDPTTGADLVPPVLTALRDREIEVVGLALRIWL